jgi:hypothetical protein
VDKLVNNFQNYFLQLSKSLKYICIMETTEIKLPQRSPEQLHNQGGNLLRQCFEQENGTNCYGHIPQKTNAPDYLRAKKKALKIAKQYNDTPLYLHIKNFL